jgi:L-Ala-D/L-Glu epimerase
MQLKYYTYELPFKYSFATARGVKTHQPTLVIELEHFGIKGYGEAPAIAYYDVTVEKMVATLESKRKLIETYNLNDPERFWHFLHHLIPDNNFLICALDMAAWDLWGKINSKPLYELWNVTWNNSVLTDYTIGMDTVEKMVEKMKAFPNPIYKIKMGLDNDIEMIKALRKETDATFRVDVNSGWSLPEANEKINILKELDIQFVEEPLKRFDYENMKTLFSKSALPLMADESCVTLKDIEHCKSCYNGINIKLTKCGGLTPALEMIQLAKSYNMKVMVGCMNESTIGSAAMAHLLPLIDYIDIDGPLLLDKDIATGLTYNNGKVDVTHQPGLGIQFTG